MNTIFIFGPNAIGKSTMIKRPVARNLGIIQELDCGVAILGRSVVGADNLAGVDYEKSIIEMRRYGKGIIVCSMAVFARFKFVQMVSRFSRVHGVFMDASFLTCQKRMLERSGKRINKVSFIKIVRSMSNVFNKTNFFSSTLVIDAEQPVDAVRKNFWDYVNSLTSNPPLLENLGSVVE